MSASAPAPPVPPPKKPPPPPPPPVKNGNSHKVEAIESEGLLASPQKIVIYGPGGVGKTELASLLQRIGKTPKFIDLDEGSRHQPVKRVMLNDWASLRGYINDPSKWTGIDALVIDSLTRAEELAVAWTIANVPTEKSAFVKSIEGYGFGKGYQHVYETMLCLLGDLDQHIRAGRDVVLICHECVANVPNPSGDDFIRYEPRLQASQRASIRHRVKEWCDHLLFIGYDLYVKDEKAMGSGTRTIYPQEMPTHWAKSRTLKDPVPYVQNEPTIWQHIFGGNHAPD